jgi:hypothetical protein
MARVFETIDEWELWIPPLGDEREIFEHDPDQAVTMEIRHLVTKEQRDHYNRIAERYKKTGAAGSAEIQSMRQMFADNVRNVKNYGTADHPITNGAEMFDFEGDNAMIDAVTLALLSRSRLDEGLAKKLKSGSGTSTEPRSPSEGGAARLATLQSTPSTRAASPIQSSASQIEKSAG